MKRFVNLHSAGDSLAFSFRIRIVSGEVEGVVVFVSREFGSLLCSSFIVTL